MLRAASWDPLRNQKGVFYKGILDLREVRTIVSLTPQVSAQVKVIQVAVRHVEIWRIASLWKLLESDARAGWL